MNKFKKLEVGQVFKSYKQVCEFLGEIIKSGDSKISQLKEWDRYFTFKKDGNKFIITEIHERVKDKLDGRINGNNTISTPLLESNPALSSEWNTDKNGELTNHITRTTNKKYWWICSTCKKDIYEFPTNRFNKNKTKFNGFSDECITCYYCTLSKGAKKVFDFLEKYNIEFVMEYTYKDLLSDKGSNLRFDFAIIKDKEVIALIEYDGGYHDISELIQYHDKLKDEYCKLNGITLYRIHHSVDPHNRICKYLLELSLISKDDYIREYDESEVENLLKELEFHRIKVAEIESKLFELNNDVKVVF